MRLSAARRLARRDGRREGEVGRMGRVWGVRRINMCKEERAERIGVVAEGRRRLRLMCSDGPRKVCRGVAT